VPHQTPPRPPEHDDCHAIGGGRVVVPEGAFVTGSLRLKSRVTLKIDQGGILRGSPKIGDYTFTLEHSQRLAERVRTRF